mmetsp:Transcript_77052/g.174267  ORF Transcript_77052/g.174267 Transcript_77052/m.174267 type:complete len:251 (-) Transcript_77052:7-759(-)
MVYFECQKCNETVKKPKLAKHLQSCGSGYVSCIDCHKVFGWGEWELHTSCVSEAQKYQGDLYQPKDNKQKGQQKQDAWTDNVEKKISDPGSGIPPEIKNYLQRLLGFSNIPRKQKPFANFVKNSLKIWDEWKIGQIWEVISSANAPAQQNGAAAATPAAKDDAAAAPAGAAKTAPTRWGGWKRALDEELTTAGGEMPWKRLRDAVVEKCCECGQANGTGKEILGFQALAAIPEDYLSKDDELVRKASSAA